MVKHAVDDHAQRLRAAWQQAEAPLLIKLGEEASQIAALLADEHEVPPARGLQRNNPDVRPVRPHRPRWPRGRVNCPHHQGNTHPAWVTARERWASWAQVRR